MPGRARSNDLESAFILARCSKKSHDDCRRIRDALMDKSSGCIQEAFTTNAVVDGKTWCVAASALVRVGDAGGLERRLRRARAPGRYPVSVKNLKFILNEQ